MSKAEAGVVSKQNGSNGVTEKVGEDVGEMTTDKGHPLGPAPHKKPSLFQKFLRPDIYTDYATCRRLVSHDVGASQYTPEIEKGAYYNPSITSKTKLLWVPRDVGGVSREEVAHTAKITPITDEGASFNDKGKIVWDMEGTNGRPPVYEEIIYY